MTRSILLVILFLVVEPQLSQSSCQEQESQRSTSDEISSFQVPQHNPLKRYNDIDYDSFVGLMGRRSSDTADVPSQHKRDMHDIFVGLMGRRGSESGIGRPWRKEYPETRRGMFFNKCKLRFRRGL